MYKRAKAGVIYFKNRQMERMQYDRDENITGSVLEKVQSPAHSDGESMDM